MIKLDRRLREERLAAKMIMQVHDELVLEAPEAELETVEKLVVDVMETAATLDVPLRVDVGHGRDWLAAHE